ncbi:MAG: hypothetical protein FD149_588 [Rhodospirillaceae bacterium]|nr:MAG: hypothetical protein FD149_588 [Rhodospirillaceae bacterium]
MEGRVLAIVQNQNIRDWQAVIKGMEIALREGAQGGLHRESGQRRPFGGQMGDGPGQGVEETGQIVVALIHLIPQAGESAGGDPA